MNSTKLLKIMKYSLKKIQKIYCLHFFYIIKWPENPMNEEKSGSQVEGVAPNIFSNLNCGICRQTIIQSTNNSNLSIKANKVKSV